MKYLKLVIPRTTAKMRLWLAVKPWMMANLRGFRQASLPDHVGYLGNAILTCAVSEWAGRAPGFHYRPIGYAFHEESPKWFSLTGGMARYLALARVMLSRRAKR
jgi:hypothetical protein